MLNSVTKASQAVVIAQKANGSVLDTIRYSSRNIQHFPYNHLLIARPQLQQPVPLRFLLLPIIHQAHQLRPARTRPILLHRPLVRWDILGAQVRNEPSLPCPILRIDQKM